MNRHSARLARLAGGAVVAILIAPWLGSAVAQAAGDNPPPSPYTVSINPGNIPTTAGPYNNPDSCSSEFGDKADNQDGWLFVASPNDFEAFKAVFDKGTVTMADHTDTSSSTYFTKDFDHLAVLTPAGWTLENAYATYQSSDSTKDFFTLSHTCAGTPDQQPTSPDATVTPGCDSATVHLEAGSEETTFVIDHDGSTQEVTVGANQTQDVDVPWSGDSTVTVSVKGAEGALDSQDRDSGACDGTDGGSANPNVAFFNSCKKGISVVLSNMDGTEPVSFTVTFTDTSEDVTDTVPVNPDNMVKLHYPVAEDTTGTVTVSAPGLDATTHSFAKNCTTVLGEKVVKTPKSTKPPAVQGEQQQLPFTGLPTGVAAALAGVMLAAGGALTYIGRRRTARHAS